MKKRLKGKWQSRKKKPVKKPDGSWDTSDLYKSGKNPFKMEIIRHYNQMEGRTDFFMLYLDKKTGKIVKWRKL